MKITQFFGYFVKPFAAYTNRVCPNGIESFCDSPLKRSDGPCCQQIDADIPIRMLALDLLRDTHRHVVVSAVMNKKRAVCTGVKRFVGFVKALRIVAQMNDRKKLRDGHENYLRLSWLC